MLVGQLHTKAVLVLVPRVVITVPEKFARNVGREPKLVYPQGSVNRQLIPVPKIVNPVDPAKLEPIPIRQQEAGAGMRRPVP